MPLDSHPDKIYAKVKINEHYDMSLKVDTGADACVITTTDLQHFPLSNYHPSMQQCLKRIWRL